MFKGTYQKKLDKKFRFKIPYRFVRELREHEDYYGQMIIIIFGEDICVFPAREYDRLMRFAIEYQPEHSMITDDRYFSRIKRNFLNKIKIPYNIVAEKNLKPDMVLELCGCGLYFVIRPAIPGQPEPQDIFPF